jgi:hypothetical protein
VTTVPSGDTSRLSASHVAFETQVPAVQRPPGHALSSGFAPHFPAPSQDAVRHGVFASAAHTPCGSVPASTGWHVPAAPLADAAQVVQAPSHRTSQHRPAEHTSDAHSASWVHAEPFAAPSRNTGAPLLGAPSTIT